MRRSCDPLKAQRLANYDFANSPTSKIMKTVNCQTCSRIFKSKHSLEEHLRTTSADHPHCTMCARRFASEDALAAHFKGSPRHPNCVQCASGFLDRQKLVEHMSQSGSCLKPKPHPFLSRGASPATTVQQDKDSDEDILSKHLPFTSPIGQTHDDSIWKADVSQPRAPGHGRIGDLKTIKHKWDSLPNIPCGSNNLMVDTVMRARYPSIVSNAPGIPMLPEIVPTPETPSSYASVSEESLNSDLFNPSNYSSLTSPIMEQQPPSATISLDSKCIGPGPISFPVESIPEESIASSSSSSSLASVGTSPTKSQVRIHCRVCGMNPCEDPTATICGHLFCYRCIAQKVVDSKACPVCDDMLVLHCLYRLHLAA